MTIHELAKLLLAGPDVMVTVDGYEGGNTELKKVEPVNKLHLDVYKDEDWWMGEHSYSHYACENGCKHKIVDAINLGR